MIVRKKRSRVVAFPNELVVNDGEKKNRCVLVASGVRNLELDPRLKEFIARHQQQNPRTDHAVDRAKAQAAATRKGTRESAIKDARTKIVEVRKDPPGAFNEEFDRAIWDGFQQSSFTPLLQMVRSGVDPNTQRIDGTTGLMAACYRGNIETVYELLNLGADPELKDANGNSAKDFAKRFSAKQVSEQMLELLNQFDFVYDLYVVDPNADSASMSQHPSFSIDTGATLCYDDATGRLVEYVHHEDDDFGRYEDEESDSNDSGYYERHLQDEGDDEENIEYDYDDSCAYGECRLQRRHNDDDDDDDYI